MGTVRQVLVILFIILHTLFPYSFLEVDSGLGQERSASETIELAKKRSVFIEANHVDQQGSVLDVLTASDDYCGTGVVIAKNLVLTNDHILKSGASVLAEGKPAEVIKRSQALDLALLKVETEVLPRLEIRIGAEPSQRIFYVGNPGTTRDGVFPGKVVKVDDQYIYTDSFADVQTAMGASGSGLYAIDGHLIGLKKGMVPGDPGHPALSVAIPAIRIKKFLSE